MNPSTSSGVKNDIVKHLAEQAGRDESRIERGTAWEGRAAADAFHAAGVSLFTTEVKPTDTGYDLTVVKNMIAWRTGADRTTRIGGGDNGRRLRRARRADGNS